jgi:hypothetical protein
VGVPVVIVSVLYMTFLLPRWLPDRNPRKAFENMREFTVEVAVDPNGPLVGLTVEQAGLRDLERLYLVEIGRDETVVTRSAF